MAHGRRRPDDDIEVTSDPGRGLPVTDLTDFESGLGSWTAEPRWRWATSHRSGPGLYDLDPCRQNRSPQVAFIDDGLVVPGVGPTMCEDWCYGPYGYVVNHSGGRWAAQGEPDRLLINAVESPVIAWPKPAWTPHYSSLMCIGMRTSMVSILPGLFFSGMCAAPTRVTRRISKINRGETVILFTLEGRITIAIPLW